MLINGILFRPKRNVVPIHVPMWTNLENIMPNEKSQSQKAIYDDSFYKKCPENADLERQKVDLWLPRASGGEGNGTPLQYSCLENPMDGEAW